MKSECSLSPLPLNTQKCMQKPNAEMAKLRAQSHGIIVSWGRSMHYNAEMFVSYSSHCQSPKLWALRSVGENLLATWKFAFPGVRLCPLKESFSFHRECISFKIIKKIMPPFPVFLWQAHPAHVVGWKGGEGKGTHYWGALLFASQSFILC